MPQLLASDLDGTILARNTPFNPKDIAVLETLGKESVIRVAATGRTFQSALSVMADDFPIDYLVFSSGAGIYNWNTKQLLQTRQLSYKQVADVVDVYNAFDIEYTVHFPIPDNHLFYHPAGSNPHPDFERYIEFNKANAELINGYLPEQDYTQVLAFVPNMKVFNELEKRISGVKVIRATSPIDGESIWMECFNTAVSKANGILEVCKLEAVDEDSVSVIGNDFNDVDMLEYFKHAYVVDNSPTELKEKYSVVRDVYSAPLEDWYKRFNL